MSTIKYLETIRNVNRLLILFLAVVGLATLGMLLGILAEYSIFAVPILLVVILLKGTTAIIFNGVYLGILLTAFLRVVAKNLRENSSCITMFDLVAIQVAVTSILSFLSKDGTILKPSPILVPTLILWAPILEEVLFRGILVGVPLCIKYRRAQPLVGGTKDRSKSAILLMLVSASVFSLFHLYLGPLGVINAFVAGVILAYIFIEFGLLESIFVHSVLNTTAAVLMVALLDNSLLISIMAFLANIVFLVIGCIGVTLIGVMIYGNLRRRKNQED